MFNITMSTMKDRRLLDLSFENRERGEIFRKISHGRIKSWFNVEQKAREVEFVVENMLLRGRWFVVFMGTMLVLKRRKVRSGLKKPTQSMGTSQKRCVRSVKFLGT